MPFIIEKLTAFITVDENGEEGVIGAMLLPGQWMPFIGADETRIKQFYPLAKRLATTAGKEMKILQFDHRVDVTEEVTNKYD